MLESNLKVSVPSRTAVMMSREAALAEMWDKHRAGPAMWYTPQAGKLVVWHGWEKFYATRQYFVFVLFCNPLISFIYLDEELNNRNFCLL